LLPSIIGLVVFLAQASLYALDITGEGGSGSEHTFDADATIDYDVTLYFKPTDTDEKGGIEQGGLIKVDPGVHLIFTSGTTLKLETETYAGGKCNSNIGSANKGVCGYSKEYSPSIDYWYKYIMLDAKDATLEFN
jgi:hypothetical protein